MTGARECYIPSTGSRARSEELWAEIAGAIRINMTILTCPTCGAQIGWHDSTARITHHDDGSHTLHVTHRP